MTVHATGKDLPLRGKATVPRAPEVQGHAPIDCRAEDRLNRRDFAETLGKAAAGWTQDRSLTVGLYGPWGSGKTSILNMAVEWIEQDCPEPKPAILRFNPWEWSGQEALFRAFFDELGGKLAAINGGKPIDLWNHYADQLQLYSTVVQSVTGLVTPTQGVALAAIVVIGGTAATEVGRNVALIACLILLLFSIPKVIMDFRLQLVLWREKKLIKEGKSTLYDAKERLGNLLRGFRSNLVVIIDDVDRLAPDQIAMMFQLIKANADFPRLVYVLAFQRDTIEAGLESARKVNGADYLEKIIQVPFDVPYPDATLLRRELEARISEMLAASGLADEFDWERWSSLWDSSLSTFFDTVRHVSRYVDSLAYQCTVLSVRGPIDVDMVDLSATVILQIFVPEVHRAIAQSRQMFVRMEMDQSLSDVKRGFVDDLCAHLPPARRLAVLKLLQELFPAVAEAYGNGESVLPLHAVNYPDRRICNPELFQRYFQKGIPSGDIPHSEVVKVVAELRDEDKFRVSLARHQSAGTLRLLLDRVFSMVAWAESEEDLACIVPLIDLADELPNSAEASSTAGFGTIKRLSADWLARLKSSRSALLSAAVERCHGLVLSVHLTRCALEQALQEERDRAQTAGVRFDSAAAEADILAGDLGRCTRLCRARIEAAAESGVLLERPEVFELLRAWADWGDLEQVRSWVLVNGTSEPEFIRLLRSVWGEAGWREGPISWRLLSKLDDLLPAGFLGDGLARLATTELPARDRTMLDDCSEAYRVASTKKMIRYKPPEPAAGAGEAPPERVCSEEAGIAAGAGSAGGNPAPSGSRSGG